MRVFLEVRLSHGNQRTALRTAPPPRAVIKGNKRMAVIMIMVMIMIMRIVRVITITIMVIITMMIIGNIVFAVVAVVSVYFPVFSAKVFSRPCLH